MILSIDLSFWQLSASIALLILMIGLSVFLQVKMVKPIFIAGGRMIAQLLMIGYLLEKIFQLNNIWLVLLVGLAMIGVAIHANAQRVSRRPHGFWLSSSLAIAVCVTLTVSFSMLAVVQPTPWYSPRYFIPFLGLIIGNTLTGISLGMDNIINALEEHRDKISAFLALGAHPREAGSPFLRQAIRTALTPILNAMTVTGLVALPGVMTGQILAGASPSKAAHYQIAIMCILSFSTMLGSTMAVFIFYHKQFGPFNRLKVS